MSRILIVDDQQELLTGLALNFRREGYEVLTAADAAAGLELAREQRPDLIILDVMLPGMNGFDVCRELRRAGLEVPIIMLTARSEEIDRVLGLEIGADDYLTKPFSVRELLARVRIHLRRRPVAPTPTSYRFGDVELDFDRLRAKRQGRALELSAKEFDLLGLLVRRRGEILTRDEILKQVWGYADPPLTRTVDTHILRLRQKIEPDPANPSYIQTVYGEGYRFTG
jgi:two-component system alkaline phosphatase synthesis response regulator PhoP